MPAGRVVLLVVAAICLGACSGSTPSKIDATITVSVGQNSGVGTACRSSDTFGTLHFELPGTEVKVTDESNKLVGVSRVPNFGVVTGAGSNQRCKFDFSIPLSGSAKFYTIDLGQFGTTTYSESELQNMGWKVSLG